MGFEWKPSPNFSSRNGLTVNWAIIHHTGGATLDGTVQWFLNPESKVSSHYVIGRDGHVVQMVALTDKAWHVGTAIWKGETPFPMNARSVGIELVNLGDNVQTYPDEQMMSLAALVKMLMATYQIPKEHVVGHKDVAYPLGRKDDPSMTFDWNKLWQMVDSTTTKAT